MNAWRSGSDINRQPSEESPVLLQTEVGTRSGARSERLQDEGADTIEANVRLGLDVDPRQYEQCAEIFLDLGLRNVRVMSNNPAKIRALEQSGLTYLHRGLTHEL